MGRADQQWKWTWITREKRHKGRDRWMFTGRRFDAPFEPVTFEEFKEKMTRFGSHFRGIAAKLLYLVDIVESFYPSDVEEGRYEEFYLTVYDYRLKNKGCISSIIKWRKIACELGLLKCTNPYSAKWKQSKAYIYNPVVADYLTELTERKWHIITDKDTHHRRIVGTSEYTQHLNAVKAKHARKKRRAKKKRKPCEDGLLNVDDAPTGYYTGAEFSSSILQALPSDAAERIEEHFKVKKDGKARKNLLDRLLKITEFAERIRASEGGTLREFYWPEELNSYITKMLALKIGLVVKTSSSARKKGKQSFIHDPRVARILRKL